MSSARRRPPARSRRQGFVLASVQDTVDVTPHMRRVTLAAPEIRGYDGQAADQFVRLLLAGPGQQRPTLPATAEWWQELLALPASDRPVLRNYTIRHLRRDRGELDIDFVLHGDTGPASAWAARARPGDVVGLLEQHASYLPGRDAEWVLLVGDETAVPAISSILEGVPAQTRVEAFVEVPSAEDVQPLPAVPGVRLHWFPRDRLRGQPGALVQRAVRAAVLPAGRGYGWVAGEAAMTTAVRRHLVNDRGFAKSAVEFCGYWRKDRPAYD